MNASGNTKPRLIFGLPETVVDFLIPIVLNLIFIALVALLSWPMGKTVLALRLAKGYLIFWTITFISVIALYQIQRLLRVSLETRVTAFVISNLVTGMYLLTGWSAFAAIAVHEASANSGVGSAVVLWIVGLVSVAMAHVVLTTFHKGTIYTFVNLLVVVVSFVFFGVWPTMAQITYGWFFNLFG